MYLDYFIVEDCSIGKFLKVIGDIRKPDAKFFWVEKREATIFLNLFSNRNILEKLGLCKGDYIWIKCNETGDLL